MIKLICLDYSGAILQTKGDDIRTLIHTTAENSNIGSNEKAAEWLQKAWDALESKNSGDDALSMDELIDRLLNRADMEIQLRCDHSKMKTLLDNYMMYGPIGTEVAEFLRLCPVPVYITSMNSAAYVNVCLRRNRLHVNNVISAEKMTLKYSTASLLEEAQRLHGCEANEILYVGRHPQRDIVSAENFGASAVLLDRRARFRGCNCRRIRSLIELLPQLTKETESR